MIITGSLVVITMFFGWNLQKIEFDFEFEKFFPKDHPDSRFYQEHVKQFGYDNDFLHIIVENETSVFNVDFLTRATAFEEELSSIEDVEKIYSPLSLQHIVRSPTGIVIFPLIHSDDSSRLIQDSIRVYTNELYRSAFGEDGKAVSIYLGHAHFDDPIRTENLLNSIKSKAQKYELGSLRLVGKLSASQVFVDYIRKDFGMFLGGSIIVSFIFLLFIFRNLKSALLPFLISILSIVWTFGMLAFMGVKINLLSSLLPPILFFVSMSDAIHLLNAIRKSKQKETNERLIHAIKLVWLPTLLTSLTTGIGFLSLMWINTEPVQLLGVFAAVGIAFAFIVTFTFGLVVASLTTFTDRELSVSLPRNTVDTVVRRKRVLIIGLILLITFLTPGITRLKFDAYLLDDLPNHEKVRQDFEYADGNLGGSKPYEIRIEVKDSTKSIWDRDIMDEIVKVESYMLEEVPVTKVQSPSTIIKYLMMVNNGGLNTNFRYPKNENEYDATLKLKRRIDPKRMDKLVTKDGRVARLIGFIPEWGSFETQQKNYELQEYLDDNIDLTKINYRITGTTYLIDKSHELLSKNLLMGLATAIGVIGIILAIYFRSWKLLIISMIPNIIPLVMVAGILGWMSVSLKMTTSIIFTIVFGIAVDDTIHMMSFYMKTKEQDPILRMKKTFAHAGSAMLITSLIMTAGFVLFLFSSFGATFYMGLFVSLSLIIALIIDLTLLPILLITFIKKDA